MNTCQNSSSCISYPAATAVPTPLLGMDGYRYEGDAQQGLFDYRLIVGDVKEPPVSPSHSSQRRSLINGCSPIHSGHLHGHETAAQRYSATRLQAGYEPER